MVKKWDLSDFKHGLVVGQAGTGIITHQHLQGLQRLVQKEK